MLAIEAPERNTSDWIAQRRIDIDAYLDKLLRPEHVSPVSDAMRYSVLAPGKRMRPLLTLAVSEFLGGDENIAMQTACAVEMIHCASLILDDMPCMDDDRERRSRLSTHVVYGENLTILAAVSLLTQSHCVIASHDALPTAMRLELIRMLCDTVGRNGLSLGQYIDLSCEQNNADTHALTEMHHLKTGILFLAAARAGCLVGNATPEQEEAVIRFASNIGLAYQLQDDLADVDEAGPNLVARIGVQDARRKLTGYTRAAQDAVAGHPNGDVMRAFIDNFICPA
jgi:geranylgeranyl diphosphate synthase type II